MIKKEMVKELTIEDIFLIADIMANIEFNKGDLEGKSEVEMGTAIIFKILKSTKKIKKDFYQLLSNITGVELDKVKAITYKEMLIIWEGVKEANNLAEVFQQAKGMI